MKWCSVLVMLVPLDVRMFSIVLAFCLREGQGSGSVLFHNNSSTTRAGGRTCLQGIKPQTPQVNSNGGSANISLMVSISFTANLIRHTRCPDAAFEAETVAQLFDCYFDQWPEVRGYVLDDQGAVRNHVIVLVDGRSLHDRQRQSDALESKSEVFVIQALSGG